MCGEKLSRKNVFNYWSYTIWFLLVKKTVKTEKLKKTKQSKAKTTPWTVRRGWHHFNKTVAFCKRELKKRLKTLPVLIKSLRETYEKHVVLFPRNFKLSTECESHRMSLLYTIAFTIHVKSSSKSTLFLFFS